MSSGASSSPDLAAQPKLRPGPWAVGAAIILIFVAGTVAASTTRLLSGSSTPCTVDGDPPLSLGGCDLRNADLKGVDLRAADLRAVTMDGIDLSNRDLRGADLSGASLAGADLSKANLAGANFSGATVRGAKFDAACLRGVDLTRIDDDGATWSGADLSGSSRDASPAVTGTAKPPTATAGKVPPSASPTTAKTKTIEPCRRPS